MSTIAISWDKLLELAEPYPDIKNFILTVIKTREEAMEDNEEAMENDNDQGNEFRINKYTPIDEYSPVDVKVYNLIDDLHEIFVLGLKEDENPNTQSLTNDLFKALVDKLFLVICTDDPEYKQVRYKLKKIIASVTGGDRK